MKTLRHQYKIIRHNLTRDQVLELGAMMIFVVVMYLLLRQFSAYLQSAQVKFFIAQTGILGWFVYAALYVFTNIVAAVPGFAFEIMAIGLFGLLKVLVVSYILGMCAAAIDFYIARRYGRDVLRKLVGKSGLRRIDKYSHKLGPEALVVSRLFEGHLFKWISFAAGLTDLPFRQYMITTLWASLPYYLILLILGLKIRDLSQLFVVATAVNYVLVVVPVVYYIGKHFLVDKHNKYRY